MHDYHLADGYMNDREVHLYEILTHIRHWVISLWQYLNEDGIIGAFLN